MARQFAAGAKTPGRSQLTAASVGAAMTVADAETIDSVRMKRVKLLTWVGLFG